MRTGTPSFLKILVDKAADGGVSLKSLKKALVSGEAFPPSLRDALRGLEAIRKEREAAIEDKQFELASDLSEREERMLERIAKIESEMGIGGDAQAVGRDRHPADLDRPAGDVEQVEELGVPVPGQGIYTLAYDEKTGGKSALAKKAVYEIGGNYQAIAVYDPYLHYSVFNGIVNVLTEQAAKVFRFEEQNQLHEEIIDTGLAQIYQSHLEVGERMASEDGVAIKKTLLDGKPFQKILDHARKTNPWLIVVGRIGVHSPKDETGLGSNAENILRAAPCDVLLSTRLEVPRLDVRAEETVRWTPEAEERMTHVPEQVKGIARTGVLRLALEKRGLEVNQSTVSRCLRRLGAIKTVNAEGEAVYRLPGELAPPPPDLYS